MAGAKMTTDHRWAQQRGGVPASGVAASETPGENKGAIKIVFTDSAHEKIFPIKWDEFFTKFDQSVSSGISLPGEFIRGGTEPFFQIYKP